jgi:ABC-type transport system substrate-binding protein
MRYALGEALEVAGGWIPELFVGVPTQVQLVFEPLLKADSKGNIIPWLAESYTVADDLKSVTFTLRKGVKFHDGSDFNGEVAKWNLDNFITSHRAIWTSVDLVSEYTVRCNLMFPLNNTQLSGGLGGFSDSVDTWMASKAAYDAHGGANGGQDWMRDNPVGTGPFMFKNYERDVAFRTIANPNYWKKDANGNKLPYLDGFDILYITDSLTSKAALMAGELDMAGVQLGPDLDEVNATGKITTTVTVSSTYGFYPDSAHPDSPFYKQAVREAFDYALNKEAIAKAFGYGYLKAQYQIPAQAHFMYDPNFVGRVYNPAKAKELLTAAGYPNGFHMKIIASPTGVNKDIMQAYSEQLNAVGITSEIEFPDTAKFMELEGQGNEVSVVYVEPGGGVANLNAFLNFSFNPNPPFAVPWYYYSPEFIAAFNASVNSPTLDVKKVQAVFDVMYKECAIIMAYAGGAAMAKQKYVHNDGWNDRSFMAFFNAETVWFDK